MINDALVFRFPRTPAGAYSLATETAILRAIHGRVPLPTPMPQFEHLAVDDADGASFVGYPWLPGQPLRRTLLHRLDNATQRHLASQLGGFLYALHTIPREVLPSGLHVQDGRERWRDFYDRVRATLFGSMRPAARHEVEQHFAAYLSDTNQEFAFRPVLRHGDFGPTNILYDPSARGVSGIIDFGSAGLGDPATDVAGLLGPLSYGAAFVDLLAPAYPGLAALLGRARFYAGTFALQEALWGVEHHDPAAVRRGLRPYR